MSLLRLCLSVKMENDIFSSSFARELVATISNRPFFVVDDKCTLTYANKHHYLMIIRSLLFWLSLLCFALFAGLFYLFFYVMHKPYISQFRSKMTRERKKNIKNLHQTPHVASIDFVQNGRNWLRPKPANNNSKTATAGKKTHHRNSTFW